MEATAKEFSPPPGKSLIYIYRDQTIAPTFKIGVDVDGRVAGAPDTKSFIVCTVDPGPHEIATHGGEPATVTLETEPNAVYFVWHEYENLAFGGRTRLHVVDGTQGRSLVEDLRITPARC